MDLESSLDFDNHINSSPDLHCNSTKMQFLPNITTYLNIPQNNLPDIRILTWTWNTQSVRLAETNDPEIYRLHRLKTQDGWLFSAELPDFWLEMAQKIRSEKPTICIFGFQEDAYPGSYFHSHFLPEACAELGYQLFKRAKNIGAGKTSYQGLVSLNPCLRGLRTSVYILADQISDFNLKYEPVHYNDSFSYNKGATAIYLTLPGYYGIEDTLAIVNIHLPMNSPSLSAAVQTHDPHVRQDEVFIQDRFLNAAYRTCVLQARAHPKFVLFFGDFNYRFSPFVNWSARLTGEQILANLANRPFLDEFQESMKRSNIYSFEEGVNNIGPQFAPTCKMIKSRIPGDTHISSYSLGKKDQRVPSYCDRILYNNLADDPQKKIICEQYDRWDVGIMTKSDHAGVNGLFVIRYF